MCGCVRVSAGVCLSDGDDGAEQESRYSLSPVGDVAEHETASMIRQPADHEGDDHHPWTHTCTKHLDRRGWG